MKKVFIISLFLTTSFWGFSSIDIYTNRLNSVIKFDDFFDSFYKKNGLLKGADVIEKQQIFDLVVLHNQALHDLSPSALRAKRAVKPYFSKEKVSEHSLVLDTARNSRIVSLALTKMNLLYYGLDNPISLSVNGIPKKKWVVQTSEGIEINENYTSINVLKNFKSIEFVYVGYKNRKTTVWIDTISLRVRPVPGPTAQWGNLFNDGLPKPKPLITAQTQIKASLGPSFAYDVKYEVISYRLYLVHSDLFVEKFEVEGSEIPQEIREKIMHLSQGDRIIVEGIKVKSLDNRFTYILAPMVITVSAGKNYYFLRNAIFYHRIIDQNTNLIIENSYDIKESLDSLKNGTHHVIYQNHLGMFRMERTLKNGNLVRRKVFNDFGQLVFEVFQNENQWHFIEYYPNGNVRSKTKFADSIDYLGQESLMNCNRNAKSIGFDIPQHIRRCDHLVLYAFERPIHRLYFEYNITPIGKVEIYHPNGKLYIEGEFHPIFEQINVSEEDKKAIKPICVMDGIWSFYNEDGSLFFQKTYQKGVLLD